MKKKTDLPAMPFYTGDWFKCPEVRALSLDHRALWFDLICYMWDSTERGVMVKPSGKPYSDQEIIRMVGLDNQNSEIWLQVLIEDEVCSRREDGAIYSRRMVKDELIRKIRKEVGKKGGNPVLVNPLVIQEDNQIIEDEDEDETIIKSEPEIVSGKEPKKPKTNPDFIDQILLIWSEQYKKSRGIDYIFVNRAIDRSSVAKILNIAKQKSTNATSEDMLKYFSGFFHACLNIQENWLFENICPAIILKQLNKINIKLSDGKAQQFNNAQQFSDIDFSIFNKK